MTDPERITFHDGRTMPRLGFGLWEVPPANTARVVEEGLAAGYRLIDGAAAYGNEEGLGEGLRNSGLPREAVFVTTKVWNESHGYEAALKAFDASLRRLGLDYVDLYLIHWPCPKRGLFVDTWRALARLQQGGQARSIGVSNFNADQIDRLEAETGVRPVLNQVELHPELPQADLRAAHAARGIVTQSWTPLGNGRVFGSPVIARIADRLGASPAQVVIAWHLGLGCSAIPRSTKRARLAENFAARALTLTPDDMAAIATLETGHRTGPHPDMFG